MHHFINQLKIFRDDNFLKWPVGLSLVCVLTSFLFLAFSWRKLPPLLPLFFSLPWGEEQLTQPKTLIFLLLGVLGLVILNYIFVLLFYSKTTYFSRMLSVSTVIISFMILFAIVHIIWLVT